MGKQTRMLELPTRMLEMALGSERRWKRVAILGVVIVGGIGAAAWFGIRGLESRSADALSSDLGSLEVCVLGDPLADGEAPDARVRGVQLAVAGIPRQDRAKPGEQPWPEACAPFAAAISDKLGPEDPVGAATAALTKALKEDGTPLEEPVAKAWDAIKKKGVVAKRSPGTPQAPKPLAAQFSRTAFAALPTFLGGNFALSSVRFEAHPKKKLRFLVDDKGLEGGPKLCAIGPDEAAATCEAVGPDAAKSVGTLTLLGSGSEAQPPVIGTSENKTIFRGTGSVTAPTGHGLYDAAIGDAGELRILTGDATKDLRVETSAPPKESANGAAPLAPPSPPIVIPDAEIAGPGQVAILWSRVAHQGTKPSAKPHLFVREFGATATTTDLGELADPAPEALASKEKLVDGCVSPGGELAAIRVRGAKSDQVTVFVGGRWSAIFAAGTKNGELVCHATEATLTEVQHAADGGADASRNLARVVVSKCAAGCSTSVVKLTELLSGTDVFPPDATSLAATDVGGKVALAWSSGKNGLRVRVGMPGELAKTRDTLVFDGFEHGSKDLAAFNSMKLVPFGDKALLLLATTSGVRAFRVDGDGGIKAIASK
jgi:hypothetical protein